LEVRLKKFMLNVGTVALQKAGGYDLSGLQQVELEGEVAMKLTVDQRQDGQLILQAFRSLDPEGKELLELFETTLEQAKALLPISEMSGLAEVVLSGEILGSFTIYRLPEDQAAIYVSEKPGEDGKLIFSLYTLEQAKG
jgi:hypothetical protein